MKRLYVGNFPYATTKDELEALFSDVGTITSVQVVFDRESGRSKGFGFVEFSTDEEAKKGMELDGSMFGGRTLNVKEAHARQGGGGGNRSNGNGNGNTNRRDDEFKGAWSNEGGGAR